MTNRESRGARNEGNRTFLPPKGNLPTRMNMIKNQNSPDSLSPPAPPPHTDGCGRRRILCAFFERCHDHETVRTSVSAAVPGGIVSPLLQQLFSRLELQPEGLHVLQELVRRRLEARDGRGAVRDDGPPQATGAGPSWPFDWDPGAHPRFCGMEG